MNTDISEHNIKIYESVRKFTGTSLERITALVEAVKYAVQYDIKGAMVECGVWKGGSVMAIALTLKQLHATNRHLYLYDTFSGMTKPDKTDISFRGEKAIDEFTRTKLADDSSNWCNSSLEEVRTNILSTGYPASRIHFVQGKVEHTIPENAPDEIAVLRLDTDWYESTKHELIHLFPRLTMCGVLIVDDYGHWEGARKATDDYINTLSYPVFLNRIDYTGRLIIKTGK